MPVVPEPINLGLRSMIPGIVRTLVPVLVALLVRLGLSDAIDGVWVERVLTVLITMAYYVVIRLLERHWDKIGWLLGYPAQPVYVSNETIEVYEQHDAGVDPHDHGG